MMNPLLVKAAALSTAAYICAKVMRRRSNYSEQNGSHDSIVFGQTDVHSSGLQVIGDHSSNLEDKLLELGIHVEDLQRRERDLMRQFFEYRAMKEEESVIMETRHRLMLEKARAEFMLKEISSAQDESQRMGGLMLEYIRIVHKLEDSKKENELLQAKARKLCKSVRQRLNVTRELKLRIQARKEEVLSCEEELQRKDDLIQILEDEVSQMEEVIDHMQREKIEITNKLAIDEKKETGVTKEEHEKVLKELEQLQKDREVEAKELAYLKRSNAWLRHELLSCHELNKDENENQAEEFESPEDQHNSENDDDCDCNTTLLSAQDEDRDLCMVTNNNSYPSRRHRFIQKVKKWVEGGNMDEKEKDGVGCFGNKHTVSEKPHDNSFVRPCKDVLL